MNKLLGIPMLLVAAGITGCGSLFESITNPNDPRILNGKFTGELVDWGGGVLDSAYYPGKNLLVNAYRNGTLEVLSPGSPNRVKLIEVQHPTPPDNWPPGRLQFSPDGAILYALSNKEVQLWNTGTWRVEKTYPNPTLNSFPYLNNGFLYRFSEDYSKLELYNLSDGQPAKTLTIPSLNLAPDDHPHSVYYPDATKPFVLLYGRGNQVWVWNLNTNQISELAFAKAKCTSTSGSPKIQEFWSYTAPVLSTDGSALAIGRSDGQVRVWTTASLTPSHTLDLEVTRSSGYCNTYFVGLQFADEGRTVVAQVRYSETPAGKSSTELKAIPLQNPAQAVALSKEEWRYYIHPVSNSKTVVLKDDRKAVQLNLTEGNPVWSFSQVQGRAPISLEVSAKPTPDDCCGRGFVLMGTLKTSLSEWPLTGTISTRDCSPMVFCIPINSPSFNLYGIDGNAKKDVWHLRGQYQDGQFIGEANTQTHPDGGITLQIYELVLRR